MSRFPAILNENIFCKANQTGQGNQKDINKKEKTLSSIIDFTYFLIKLNTVCGDGDRKKIYKTICYKLSFYPHDNLQNYKVIY